MNSPATTNSRATARTLDKRRRPWLALAPLCVALLLVRSAWPDDPAPGAARPHATIGASTCANASCHGNADSRDPRIWKRSYWLWTQHDRHGRAFEVLFAPRSVAMIERLTSFGEPRQNDDAGQTLMEDAESYFRQLEQRCVGCHATTPPSSTASSKAAPTARVAREYAEGVSCESCHGAAEQWSNAHYAVGWKDLPDQEKSTRFGFASTKLLANRAAVCVDCHVGPKTVEGRWYEVDHELIAAGHPRLDFEFSAALANLPPHWDAVQDRERHIRETGSTMFHFDAWKQGQIHAAQAQLKLRNNDLVRHRAVDLSRHDCFACHHQLRSDAARPREPRAATVGAPGESLGALRGAAAMFAARSHDDRTPPVAVDPFGEPLRRWLDEAVRPAAAESPSAGAAANILQQYVATLRSPQARSWEGVVGLNLALRASLADVDPQAKSPLAADVRALDVWLANCFARELPNRYHSPSRFRPLDPALGELLESLSQGITRREIRP